MENSLKEAALQFHEFPVPTNTLPKAIWLP